MKYTAVSVVTLPAGATLGLTEQQAAARKHALQPVAGAKGRYTNTQPVQFKVGEVFVYEGELPKALAESVEQAESDRRRKSEARKAQEEQAERARQADELRGHIDALETALESAETDDGRATIAQQIEAARVKLAAL